MRKLEHELFLNNKSGWFKLNCPTFHCKMLSDNDSAERNSNVYNEICAKKRDGRYI